MILWKRMCVFVFFVVCVIKVFLLIYMLLCLILDWKKSVVFFFGIVLIISCIVCRNYVC